ncbi:hypothetical protein C8R47DRAFT_184145 [Mycena vitilis]|nr:hypothetical protein C8R47DRAFT_184145 [Mycena vitilis]
MTGEGSKLCIECQMRKSRCFTAHHELRAVDLSNGINSIWSTEMPHLSFDQPHNRIFAMFNGAAGFSFTAGEVTSTRGTHRRINSPTEVKFTGGSMSFGAVGPPSTYPSKPHPSNPHPSNPYQSNPYPSNQYPQNQYPGPQNQYPQNQYPQKQYSPNQYPQNQCPSNQYPSAAPSTTHHQTGISNGMFTGASNFTFAAGSVANNESNYERNGSATRVEMDLSLPAGAPQPQQYAEPRFDTAAAGVYNDHRSPGSVYQRQLPGRNHDHTPPQPMYSGLLHGTPQSYDDNVYRSPHPKASRGSSGLHDRSESFSPAGAIARRHSDSPHANNPVPVENRGSRRQPRAQTTQPVVKNRARAKGKNGRRKGRRDDEMETSDSDSEDYSPQIPTMIRRQRTY